MRLFACRGILIFFVSSSVFGQASFPSRYSASDLALTSPSALKYGLYGYDNPALLTYLRQPDMQCSWTDATGTWNDFNRLRKYLEILDAASVDATWACGPRSTRLSVTMGGRRDRGDAR